MLHILLVEDSSAQVLLIREALRRCSVLADVAIAYDGEQALRMLQETDFRPDFIILDLNLPKFSGLDLLERFHNDRKIPIAVFTGSANEADRSRALSLGAREYVTKPASFDGFMTAICGMLQRWRADAAAAGTGV